MPYAIKKSGNKWLIINKQTGEKVGEAGSRSDAEKSVNARLAGEHKKKKGK